MARILRGQFHGHQKKSDQHHLRSIMFGTSKYLQYKTQSQNNWKHILTFRETTSHIVKSNEWRKTQSTSI